MSTRPEGWGKAANVGVPVLQRDASGVVPTNHRSAAPDQWRWGFGPASEPQRGAPELANREEHLLKQDPEASPNPGGRGHVQRQAAARSDNCVHRHGCSLEQRDHDGGPTTNGDRNAPRPPVHRRTAPSNARVGRLPWGAATSAVGRALPPASKATSPPPAAQQPTAVDVL